MNNMNDKNFDLVMPAAKKLILENDIDANIMQGTGKDGRITKGDVLLFLKLTTPFLRSPFFALK